MKRPKHIKTAAWRRMRNKELRQDRARGLTVTGLGAKYGLSRRQVFRIIVCPK